METKTLPRRRGHRQVLVVAQRMNQALESATPVSRYRVCSCLFSMIHSLVHILLVLIILPGMVDVVAVGGHHIQQIGLQSFLWSAEQGNNEF